MDKEKLIEDLCEVTRDSVFKLSQDEIDVLVEAILILQKL